MRCTSSVVAPSLLLPVLVVPLVVLLAGCGDSLDPRRGDGAVRDTGFSRDSTAIPRDGTTPDASASNCAALARWVYLVDADQSLLRFQPDDLSITEIGLLDCASGVTPFSMSVDRNGQAWVLHQDRRIYKVSTADASCTSTDYTPNQDGLELFGMGFAADADMSAEETLFVAGGGAGTVASGMATLAAIDDTSLILSTVGGLPGWPELTGTGSGELWGFFPDTSPPSVRLIDKSTATTGASFDMAELSGLRPSAWAFAFWGGRFYVFYQAQLDPSTNVWRVDPDGTVTQVLTDIGYRIVGAGVSTCAPVELI
ncbi:MAG: hypothetical protein JRH11_15405 [Deltaproteobacteria bacterium]|nr:hypothetical protein [Deltaproteobacteria bacterium]